MKYNVNNQKSPEYFTTFRSLREHPNECLYCLSVDSINTNEINKNNYITYNINKESKVYRGINNTAIEIFDYKLTCFEFLSNNGIDFLIFALFQMNMPQLNLTKHETSDFILTCLSPLYILLGFSAKFLHFTTKIWLDNMQSLLMHKPPISS